MSMRTPYLEVIFRHGRALAAYLYLPRRPGTKSCDTARVDPGMVVDFDERGRAIGIEITAPSLVGVEELNRVLRALEAPVVEASELAPLRAA